MKIIISKDIVGKRKDTDRELVHARTGDTLDVLLDEGTHFICINPIFPEDYFPVFKSNVKQILNENDLPGDEEDGLPGSDDVISFN